MTSSRHDSDAEGAAFEARRRHDARRVALLRGPIVPALLALAAPMVAVLIAQTVVSVAETFYVGFLGTEALAGVALVFPIVMLMTMMSNGGVGGGVASAIARATGAGSRDDADALVRHALVLAVIFGVAFTVAALGLSPRLYRALGGKGAELPTLPYTTIEAHPHGPCAWVPGSRFARPGMTALGTPPNLTPLRRFFDTARFLKVVFMAGDEAIASDPFGWASGSWLTAS